METQYILRLCLFLMVSFKSTSICADGSAGEVTSVNTTVTYTTTTISENITETKQDSVFVNTSNGDSSVTADTEHDSTEEKGIKPSDAIIVGNFNNYDITKTDNPVDGIINDDAVTQTDPTRMTTVNPQRTRKTDSIISVTPQASTSNMKITPSIHVIAKTTTMAATAASSSTALGTKGILSTSASTSKTDSLVQKPSGTPSHSVDPTTPVVMSHVYSGHPYHSLNRAFPHHHIPFRHHLQLVPMEDEPFGSALMQDQRYIVSVLIPVGVGVIGAVVIMVTVYCLRQAAKKHGREFPRIDIEAGRQNIASISSERTDKMLLLDDDEDNEF